MIPPDVETCKVVLWDGKGVVSFSVVDSRLVVDCEAVDSIVVESVATEVGADVDSMVVAALATVDSV